MTTRRERGMAVVGALLVVAAASVATGAIMERQSFMADALAGERDRAQAKWLLRGGLDWARVILLSDARNNPVTLKNAVWAQPIAGLDIPLPDGRRAVFSGLIEDEQGKYNLQRLAVGGVVQPQETAAFASLLERLGLPASLAPAVAARVAAAQNGRNGPPAAPGLRGVNDLLGTAQLDAKTLAVLSDHATVLPRQTPLNVNTASAEVLSAMIPGLSPERAHELVQRRDDGVWFTNRGDFVNRLGDPKQVAGIPLDVRSDWFKVSGFVMVDGAAAHLRALLQRSGDAVPAIRWIGS